MKIESVKTDNIELKSKCDAIRFQTNSMETYSRRDNLLFYGIRQPINKSNFSCAKSVRKFLVDQLQMTEEEASSVQFVRCDRLNEHNKRSIKKPIIARVRATQTERWSGQRSRCSPTKSMLLMRTSHVR